MAQPILAVKGRLRSLAGDDVDTDRIIPARFLKTTSFETLGSALFFDERFEGESGRERPHPLNVKPRPNVLLVDRNFGCGSSREHAAHAIQLFGIQAIVALSFGDIFKNNCRNLGIPCACVSMEDHQSIRSWLVKTGRDEIVIDIEAGCLRLYQQTFPLLLSDYDREVFLSGSYDCFDKLMANMEQIRALDRCLSPSPILAGE